MTGAPTFLLELIGDFRLTHHGAPLILPPIGQRVVALVALHQRPVPRSRVRAALWPDADEDRARASLRSALWRIPTPDGHDILQATATHLAMADTVAIDLRTCLAEAIAWSTGVGRGDPTVVAASLQRDLLPEWDDQWLDAERERFYRVRVGALDTIAERLCNERRYSEAIAICSTTTDSDPLRESTHRILARAHAGLGNVADAIRLCLRYERRLVAELGVRPSLEMRSILADLRACA